jgi:hypothetical protein
VTLLDDAEYTEIAKVALYQHCLAPTTVDAERGFSRMNRIKTSTRNRLKAETMNALVSIKSHDSTLSTFPFQRLL